MFRHGLSQVGNLGMEDGFMTCILNFNGVGLWSPGLDVGVWREGIWSDESLHIYHRGTMIAQRHE